ncbi:MAG: MFS transporter, partial [Saprospiraceae bacterium]|nr:MFS transporter [Saprospiraceae bacterium]
LNNFTFLNDVTVSNVWRGMFGSEMIPAGLFFITLLFIPESPRWLIKNGEKERGLETLTRFGGPVLAQLEFREISESLKQIQGKISELFRPGLRRALWLGVGLSVFGQFTGVNIVVYYGPSILENAGFKLDNALQFQVAIGLINLLFTIIALFKIDSWGRRPLLLWGMAAVCLSLLVIGFQFMTGSTSGISIVVMLCIYMAGLAISINAVIWVLLGEIYPNRLRGRAMGIATFANWATNFITAFLFPWYVSKIGMHAGFFTFAFMCFLAIIFFYRMVPETKGKSLEEIEHHWER